MDDSSEETVEEESSESGGTEGDGDGGGVEMVTEPEGNEETATVETRK